MLKEELELYKELQPYFPQDWQVGDRYYDPVTGLEGWVSLEYVNMMTRYNFLHLPLPIDPVSPERGLWGMIDWSKWQISTRLSGLVSTHQRGVFSVNPDDRKIELLTLALLRALKAQAEEKKCT